MSRPQHAGNRPPGFGDEKRLCSFLDALHQGVQENDCDGRITYSNRAHHELLGRDVGELVGKRIWDFLPSDEEKQSLKDFFIKLKTERPPPSPFVTTHIKKDGTMVDLQVDWNYLLDDDKTLLGFVSIITDATERRNREAALSDYARGVSTLLDVSKRLLSTLDLQTILQATSDGVTSLVGLNTAAIYLLEDDLLNLWAATPPLPPDFPDAMRTSPLADNPHLKSATDLGGPVLLPDAIAASLSSVERDIVQQRNLRTLLFLPLIAEGEVSGALIVGSIGEPTAIHEDKIQLSSTFANLAALAVKNARLYKAGRRYASELEQSLAERERAEAERKALQEQLFHAQKMDAVGQLAGSVAHDFNNQLGGIIGYAELLKNEVHDERPKKFVSSIITLSGRAADLTAQLLAFARKGPILSTEVDLHKIVDEVVTMLEHIIDRKIVIRRELDASEHYTAGDPTQIQSAFLNLAVNARDAMPSGGEMRFKSENIRLDMGNPTLQSLGLHPGKYVLLSVRDTGVGMDAATMERIFEPFFTTKEMGRGTGMGLAAVYGTLKTHRGAVRVRSMLGEGAIFELFFPSATVLSDAPFEKETSARTAVEKQILLVDDEEISSMAAAEHLKSAGYFVHLFTTGTAALAYFEEHHAELSLVILDMIMPKMGGVELCRRMKKIRPDVRILIASGFSMDEDVRAVLSEGGAGFISKPFSKIELLDAAAEMLEK